MSPVPARLARLAGLLAAPVIMSACANGGAPTEPGSLLAGAQRTAAFAGVWAFDGDAPQDHPFFRRVVADTIRLGGDRKGEWIRIEEAGDDATHHRSVGEVEWRVDDAGTLWIVPICHPAELCDPFPPWYGILRDDGRIDVFPNPLFSLAAPPRPYRKVAR